VFFGVSDKDPAGICRVVGLTNEEFKTVDIGEIATRLRSAFDPTPRFKKSVVEIGGKVIGVLEVERHSSRPVIATKNEGGSGEIKEGDIFYRYPGMSRRISYADLRGILDERDIKTRESILPMIRRLLEIGPENAMIADLSDGKLTDGQTSVQLDDEVVRGLNLAKEGELSGPNEGTALRLVGEVQDGVPPTVKKGSVTRDDLRRDFLRDVLQADPADYLRIAIDMPANEWVPMRGFALKARMNLEALREFVTNSKGTQGRKDLLLRRLSGPDQAYTKAPARAAQLKQQLSKGQDVVLESADDARTVALAIIAIERPLNINREKLRRILLRCLDLTSDSNTQMGRSEVRKAIARFDELLSPW